MRMKTFATVAQALGTLGDPTAVDPLTTALKGEDPAVRYAATMALKELGIG
jgi:HEAT repeat protein